MSDDVNTSVRRLEQQQASEFQWLQKQISLASTVLRSGYAMLRLH